MLQDSQDFQMNSWSPSRSPPPSLFPSLLPLPPYWPLLPLREKENLPSTQGPKEEQDVTNLETRASATILGQLGEKFLRSSFNHGPQLIFFFFFFTLKVRLRSTAILFNPGGVSLGRSVFSSRVSPSGEKCECWKVWYAAKQREFLS